MGRSVSYLSDAHSVSYFDWPRFESGEEEDYEVEYESATEVIQDIQETIKSKFPEFDNADKWEGREDHIILEGYGCQIGLSEYCGLASLSIRIDPRQHEDGDTEEISKIEKWIDNNWPKISKYYNRYKRVGTFSNGESVYSLN